MLVSGHVVADFLLQGERLAQRKNVALGALLAHAGLVLVAQLLLLVPFAAPGARLSWLLAVSAGLAAFHLVVDRVKAPLERRGRRVLTLFFIDQAVHVAALIVSWRLLLARGVGEGFLVPGSWLGPIAGWSLLLAGVSFNGNGGTAIVRKLLERYAGELPEVPEPEEIPPGTYEMGRTIGVLERLLVFLLVVLYQWGALGLVLAAKSLARWPEFRERHFAEYYLIGTLASILVAVVTGLVVRWSVL
jgi:hypothetical protein